MQVADHITRVQIDPNIRIGGGKTLAGFEDCSAPVCVGQVVAAVWMEVGSVTPGVVTEVDEEKRLVTLVVNWGGLDGDEPTPDDLDKIRAMIADHDEREA